MGNLFSRESTTDSFEKALDALDAKIRNEHVRLASLKPRRAAANRSATLYALAFWGVLVSIAFNVDLHSRISFDILESTDNDTSSTVTPTNDHDIVVVDGADRWKTDALRFIAVAIGPVILIFIRRLIAWWFDRSQESSEASLEALRAKQRAKIEELKSITAFYRAKELIERYEHLLVDPSAQQASLPPHLQQPQQQHGRNRHHTHDPRLQQPVSAPGAASPLVIDPNTRQPSTPNLATSDTTSATSPLALEAPPPTAVDPNAPSALSAPSTDPTESSSSSSGWFSKIVERVVVGGDELEANQKFALICGLCHHHNGLAWPSEFPTMRFICRHCATLNDRGALATGGPWLFQKVVPDGPPTIEAPPNAPFPPDHIVPPAINVMPPTPEAANVPLPPSPFARAASVGAVQATPGVGDVPPLPNLPAPVAPAQACHADEPNPEPLHVPVPVADAAVQSSGAAPAPAAGAGPEDASGTSLLPSPVASAHVPPALSSLLSSGGEEDGGWERVDSPSSVVSLSNRRSSADVACRLDQVVSPSISTSTQPPSSTKDQQIEANLPSQREDASSPPSSGGERSSSPSPKDKAD